MSCDPGITQRRRKNSKTTRILVIGELNVDIVATGLSAAPQEGTEVIARDCELTLGSASAIFSVGMAKLGHRVTFVSQVGEDSFGDYCLRELKKSAVSTRNVLRNREEKTGVTIAISGARDRALITYPGAITSLTADQVDEKLFKTHHHLHLTSYYLQRGLQPSFSDLFQTAQENGLTTSFDPNAAPSGHWRKTINKVLRYTDVLFVNEREASELTGIHSAEGALKSLGKLVPCAVVKLGAKGAIAIKDDNLFADSGFKITPIDTTGAGDSFDAGFISAYLQSMSLSECLRMGNVCGAMSALRVGGTPGQPNQNQLRAFARSVKKSSSHGRV